MSSQRYLKTHLDQLAAAVHEIRSKVHFLLGLQGFEVLEVSSRPVGCNGSQVEQSVHSSGFADCCQTDAVAKIRNGAGYGTPQT